MYIDINLLPQGLRPKKPGLRLNIQTVMVLVFILAAGGMGVYYFQLDKSLKALESRRQSLMKQRMMLTETINLQKEVEELTAEVSDRVNIIKELTADSDIRFAMLKHINSIIPPNLWLLNIIETSAENKINFNIEGMSYSKESITSFLEGLERYEKFTNVGLRSITPSPMEVKDAFEYIVNVELAAYQPPEPEEDKDSKSNKKKAKK